MRGRDLSAALRSGKQVYGTCVISTAPRWPAAIASLGLDLVFIDTEHVSIGRDKLSWLCGSYSARGVAPVVRIPKPDPYWACMALDGGAHGIIVPYVETVEQVRALRGAVKMRPLKGERLYGALEGKIDLGEEVNTYLEKFNRDSVLIVNIESQAALDNLDEILAEPGLDAVLVGPHDLSINLGHPEQYDHPKFQEAIGTIIRKARAANVGAGIHYFMSIEQEIAWAKEGANLTMHSSDIVLMRQTLAADLERFRKELGDGSSEDDDPNAGIV